VSSSSERRSHNKSATDLAKRVSNRVSRSLEELRGYESGLQNIENATTKVDGGDNEEEVDHDTVGSINTMTSRKISDRGREIYMESVRSGKSDKKRSKRISIKYEGSYDPDESPTDYQRSKKKKSHKKRDQESTPSPDGQKRRSSHYKSKKHDGEGDGQETPEKVTTPRSGSETDFGESGTKKKSKRNSSMVDIPGSPKKKAKPSKRSSIDVNSEDVPTRRKSASMDLIVQAASSLPQHQPSIPKTQSKPEFPRPSSQYSLTQSSSQPQLPVNSENIGGRRQSSDMASTAQTNQVRSLSKTNLKNSGSRSSDLIAAGSCSSTFLGSFDSSRDESVTKRHSRSSFAYQARKNTELSFQEGDILVINDRRVSENGRYVEAELNGKKGFVPAALVRGTTQSLPTPITPQKNPAPFNPRPSFRATPTKLVTKERKSFDDLLEESLPQEPPRKKGWFGNLVESIRSKFRRNGS